MSEIGKLLVFEGPDATGKSSIASAVAAALQSPNSNVQLLSFPGRTPNTLGETVYRVHHDCRSLGINTVTQAGLQALHIAAHLDAIESMIVPLLSAGTSVVLDRFWWSTFVYGVVEGVRPDILSALIDAERLAWGSALPTALFNITRQSPLRDEPTAKWQRCNSLYRELAQTESRKYPVHTISNEESLNAGISKVLKHIGGQ